MINPNNLPSSIPRIYAFRDHSLELSFLFPDGYDISNITSKLYYKERFHTGLVSISVSGQTVTATLTKEDFISINLPIFQIFIYKGANAIIGATVELKSSGGTPVLQTFNVILGDATSVSVEVIDALLVEVYVERAEQAADDAETFKNSAQTFATNAYNSATTATNQATISTNQAAISTTQAGLSTTARIASEAARDQIVAISNASVTVATYNDAVPLFTGSLFRRIDVIADTAYNLDDDPVSPTYNQGLPSFYIYNPALPSGKKVAFLGLDPDYLTNT